MRPVIYRMYKRSNAPKHLEVSYDTTGKRPAWIYARGLPHGAQIIRVRCNKERILYMAYLPSLFPYFLPVDHTHEELRKYYDACAHKYNKTIIKNNLPAADFLLSKINLPKNIKILDLGAGTGFCSLLLANTGYKDITLVDYSEKMLNIAKNKKELAECKFIHSDMRQLELNQKFDLVISLFSFAVDVYFFPEEMPTLWDKVASYLKPNGMLALIGHEYAPPNNLFQKIDAGYYDVTRKEDFTKWYVGTKR